MQKKPKSTQERPVPKIEAKEPFTTASAHTAVRNGFCIRLGQPWDAKVPKYTAKNGTAWCRWAWLGLAGRGLARPGMLLSLKDAKENPDHHRRPSTGGLLFCPLESPRASPRCRTLGTPQPLSCDPLLCSRIAEGFDERIRGRSLRRL